MPKKENKYSDQEYWKGIRDNDSDIIEQIFDDFESRIINHVRNNNGSREDGEDLFSKVLEIIFLKSQDKSFELTSAFYTFLYGIAWRQWLKELERRKIKLEKEVTKDLENVSINIEDSNVDFEEIERQILYREKISILGKDCQKVLDMSLNEDKNMEEIAEEMGYKSPGFARQKKYRCKEQLTNLIKSDPRYKELKR